MKNGLREWGDELYVMVFYPDARTKRLLRRLDQLERIDVWLQQLSPWEQRLLPAPFALLTACLVVWVNLLLPPPDPNQLTFWPWLGP